MQNAECIEMFEKYLKEDKNASANTLSSYLRDIRQLGEYLDANSEHGIVDASAEDLSEYIETLRAEGKSVATVSRSIASIKCLYMVDTDFPCIFSAEMYSASSSSLTVRRSWAVLSCRYSLS